MAIDVKHRCRGADGALHPLAAKLEGEERQQRGGDPVVEAPAARGFGQGRARVVVSARGWGLPPGGAPVLPFCELRFRRLEIEDELVGERDGGEHGVGERDERRRGVSADPAALGISEHRPHGDEHAAVVEPAHHVRDLGELPRAHGEEEVEVAAREQLHDWRAHELVVRNGLAPDTAAHVWIVCP